MFLPLETPRLIIRPFKDRDIEPFSRYRSDPEVALLQGWDAPYPLEKAAGFVEWLKTATPGQPGEWYQAAIERKSTGEMIGDLAYQILSGDMRQAEIGLTIARAFQGQGYGAEAMARLLDYLFLDQNLHRVRANTDPENIAAASVLQKLGFRHEGRWMESLWFKGRWADEDWYAILHREWLAKNHPERPTSE